MALCIIEGGLGSFESPHQGQYLCLSCYLCLLLVDRSYSDDTCIRMLNTVSVLLLAVEFALPGQEGPQGKWYPYNSSFPS